MCDMCVVWVVCVWCHKTQTVGPRGAKPKMAGVTINVPIAQPPPPPAQKKATHAKWCLAPQCRTISCSQIAHNTHCSKRMLSCVLGLKAATEQRMPSPGQCAACSAFLVCLLTALRSTALVVQQHVLSDAGTSHVPETPPRSIAAFLPGSIPLR